MTHAAIGDETQKNWGIGFGYEMNQLAMGINYGKVNDVLGNDGVEAQRHRPRSRL